MSTFTPTPAQLQIAFRELYRPDNPRCPDSVEAMLASDTWSIALIGVARNRARAPSIAQCPAPQRLPHAAPVPPTPAHPPAPQRARLRGPTFDARRLAANDIDDDDDDR